MALPGSKIKKTTRLLSRPEGALRRIDLHRGRGRDTPIALFALRRQPIVPPPITRHPPSWQPTTNVRALLPPSHAA
jgi:hypothetical protein